MAPTPILTPSPGPAPVQAPRYNGPLFDTHLHLRSDLFQPQAAFSSADHLLRYLDKNGEIGAIGFYILPPSASAPWFARALPIAAGTRHRIVPLLQTYGRGPMEGAFVRGDYTEAVLRGYLAPKGPFQGVGEIPMSQQDTQTITIQSPYMQTVFQAVNEMKGIVMIHPPEGPRSWRTMELTEIEPSIRQYSDTTFLFHNGFPTFDRLILPLMSRYPNVYFSMDVADWLFTIEGKGGFLLSPEGIGSGSADRFLADVARVGRDQLLEAAVRRSLGRLQQHPDRVMWGTDRAELWNFEERATELIIEMSRQFIARMPIEMQEGYAFRNAQRVFGRYLAPSP